MIISHLKPVVFLMAVFICCAGLTVNVQASDKPTVASMNLCTDRLALALADREQIISLSHVAADPNSMMQIAEPGMQLNNGSLEELLALDVDHFLTSEFEDRKLLNRLSDFGKQVSQFKAELTIDQSKQNIKRLAALLDQSERGELMIREIDQIRRFDKIPNKPRTLLLGANNYISGKNTLPGNLIESLGYVNVADEVNVTGFGQISTEQVIALNPQVIVISHYSDDYSRAQSVLQHPVLKRISENVKIINIPTREWICGDRALIDAAKRLMLKTTSIQ